MCGLSVSIIGFMYEGYHYHWSDTMKCFYSSGCSKKLSTVPVGAINIESKYNHRLKEYD